MGKLNKAESKGLLIFSVFAVFVIVIGVIMSILGHDTSGRVRPIYGEERIVNLSSTAIIWTGIIMLGLVLLLYLSMRNEDKAE